MRNSIARLSLATLLLSPTLSSHAAQECLGRLTFTVPNLGNFEWAIELKPTGFPAFSKAVYTGGSNWYYDQFLINVTDQRPIRDFNYRYTNYEITRVGRINAIEDELKVKKDLVEHLTNLKKEQEQEIAQGEKIQPSNLVQIETIQKFKADADNLQQQLDYLAKHPVTRVPLDYPDAFTVYNDVAYFWRNNRIYTFGNTDRKNNLTLDQLNQRMVHFSTRQLGEIPNRLGFCFPYGFMQDEGTTDYEIKNAFRFKDQPNVLYALYTGTERHEKFHPVLGKRNTVAQYGIGGQAMKLPTDEGYQYTQTQQQFTVDLGELGEMQLTGDIIHGVKADNPKDTLDAYIIYGSLRDTLEPKVTDPSQPYLGIQIIGYPKKPEPDYNLPNNPPAPEQALEKVKPLLKSLRLSLQAQTANASTTPTKQQNKDKKTE